MFDIMDLIDEPLDIGIVDVGAMSLGADTDAYDALLKTGAARVIGFEPMASECEKLNRAAGANRSYLPYAIGDGTARTLYVCNYPMTSSLYPPHTELLDKFQNLENLTRVVEELSVQTHRLDDVAQIGDADFLKVDVQGAEVDVFAGAARTLRGTVVIHTEVQFVPLYCGGATFSDVDAVLRRHGFLLHRFAGPSGRCFKPLVRGNDINAPGSQLLWADAVYLPDFMALDRISPAKLLKLAVILHAVYSSFDACAYVLREYQERAGGDLGDRYLRRVTQEPANRGADSPA